jgi:hypothetical protein
MSRVAVIQRPPVRCGCAFQARDVPDAFAGKMELFGKVNARPQRPLHLES